jgi:hypothetical protein
MVAKISGKINKIEERAEVEFNYLDYNKVWYTFQLNEKVFDILFTYEGEFSVQVVDTDDVMQSVKLEISLKDE